MVQCKCNGTEKEKKNVLNSENDIMKVTVN